MSTQADTPTPAPTPSPWRATALTLFPDAFPGVLGTSIIGGAEKSGIWQLETVDIRDFSTNRHRSVDSPPSGGGPGMVSTRSIPSQESLKAGASRTCC